MSQKVISREYKVMLEKDRFRGSHDDLLRGAVEFWTVFSEEIADLVLDTDAGLDRIDKDRTVRFYDTAGRRLRTNDYVFRERVDNESGKREVTLKFRHPDRYVAQARNMDAADPEQGKTKFEEDVKLPFTKLYSFSTKQQISPEKTLNKMDDPASLYPDLKKHLDVYDEDEELRKVGGFTGRELVIEGADFQIGSDPKVEAECGLVAWYKEGGGSDQLVVVEFSFKYENEHEHYDGEVAQRAFDVFAALGKKETALSAWVDAEGPTKTKYVYDLE